MNESKRVSRASTGRRPGKAAAFLALALGLLASGFMWNLERQRVNTERAAALAERANYLAADIRQRLVAFELALRGGASLFAATEPSRAQWRNYVDALNLDTAYPGVQGVAFAAWLDPRQVPAVERAVRAEGFEDFRVWPPGAREEQSAIIYIEPLDAANRRALGYDMYADPVRQAAMAAARDEGTPVLTGHVSLVQDAGDAGRTGVLLYVPLFRYGEATGSLDERRRAFLGWVYAPFRPRDLMAGLNLGRSKQLAIRLFDGPPEQTRTLLYESAPAAFEAGRSGNAIRVPIEFAHRVWTLEAQPRADALAEFRQRWHWEYVAGGILVSLMLFFLVRSISTTRDRAYALAETMTEALRRSNAELDERVHARTAQLSSANLQLHGQIAEREIAERERSLAYAQQAERNAQLRALAQASVAIGSLHDAASRLDYLADKACQILACRSSVVIPAGVSARTLLAETGDEAGNAAGAQDDVRRELLAVAASRETPDALGPLNGIPNVLAVPIRITRGREFGTLYLSRPPERPFSGEDQAIVRQLMLMAAASVAMAEAAEDEHRARLEAEAANALKDRFLAIVSHELRSPLHAILGWLGVIERRQDASPTLQRALSVIRRNAEAQSALIDDLLDLARIEQGKLQIDRVPVEFSDLVLSVVESQQLLAAERGIELVARIESDGIVEGDPLRLQQLIANLVGNGLKFTPAGGKVSVGLRQAQRELVLEVADNGQGIDPSMLDAVFDQFRQVDSSSSRRHGGLGLGLSLVRHIAELHGGQVRAASAGLGCGASFEVRLPLMRWQPEADLQLRGGRASPKSARLVSVSVTGPDSRGAGESVGRRTEIGDGARNEIDTGARRADAGTPERIGASVMVVDDQADAREAVADCLEDEGFEAMAFGSVDAALAWLEEREFAGWPTAVLCDIEMPGRDGLEFVAAVRELELQRGHVVALPIIAVTAHSSPEDRERTLANGFLAHFSKPLRIERVVGLLASLTRGW